MESKIKGTDVAGPKAESEKETLASQRPSWFKRGILMEASPLTKNRESLKMNHEKKIEVGIAGCKTTTNAGIDKS